MDEKDQIERQLTESLTEGTMESNDPNEKAPERLRTRYEIRIQAVNDPIVEETQRFRSLAEEIDDRYDDYMRRAKRGTPEK